METMKSIKDLKASFKKLPGIGEKTSERLAYAVLNFSKEEIEEFKSSLDEVMTRVHVCPKCGQYIDTPYCPVCDDSSRDKKTILVVGDMKDVLSFEKTEKYHGLYFVLNGLLSPLKGKDPASLRLPYLRQRVIEEGIEEVILATSSTLEGETTALYINKYLKDTGVKLSRLAYGLPVGADLEYVDYLTIERSLASRTDMKGE